MHEFPASINKCAAYLLLNAVVHDGICCVCVDGVHLVGNHFYRRLDVDKYGARKPSPRINDVYDRLISGTTYPARAFR